MFVPSPNAAGSLLITAQALDNVITVDTGLYQTLEGILGVLGDDHTYVRVGAAPYMEYIKVTGVSNIPNQLIVERGADGTSPQVHAANTPIEYVLAYTAIADAIADAEQLTVSLEGDGNVEIEEVSTNNFVIRAPYFGLVSENQSIYAYNWGRDDDTNTIYWDVSVNPEMFGKCNPTDNGGGY